MEFLSFIQENIDDNKKLYMDEVEQIYASKMREYNVQYKSITRRWLKRELQESLQNINVEGPYQINKPDIVLSDKSARDAICQATEKQDGDLLKHVFKWCQQIRAQISALRNKVPCDFEDSLASKDESYYTKDLVMAIRWIIHGTSSPKLDERRVALEKECHMLADQFLQKFKTRRQVTYTNKTLYLQKMSVPLPTHLV